MDSKKPAQGGLGEKCQVEDIRRLGIRRWLWKFALEMALIGAHGFASGAALGLLFVAAVGVFSGDGEDGRKKEYDNHSKACAGDPDERVSPDAIRLQWCGTIWQPVPAYNGERNKSERPPCAELN
ncbi:hypothetical protein [Paenirhodobacter populi]|uniref:Uncharacterized protein n=1 Tax=Paenirhodobacter populi TaxID=2306993 RepID=A0A443JE22_9RHOB|nr:hypothetical protein [Sinirhodobacter populi]RWR18819.1 hypothetical protein D2T30_15790 [Sinirhodobacter populi]